MSSTAGLRPVSGFGYYSAAKHAIEAVAATLRNEVAGFGIRVLTVEPGAYLAGKGGVRIEDVLVVGADGAQAPREDCGKEVAPPSA